MKKILLGSLVAGLFLLACSSAAVAQRADKANAIKQKFEGVWQVSMQKWTKNGSDKFVPPRARDFKIYDADGSFRHIIFSNDKYVELSKGKMVVTSDSTYTEQLEKHLGIKEGKGTGNVTFRFLDADTFLMKWTLNGGSGEEIYERVK
ncbi:MAG: DUF4488 domain-containing protein [Niabella sp.]